MTEEKECIERKEEGLLVKGIDTEEREKYRLFLAYCEERRKEWRKQEEEDTTRKEMQMRKEEHWKLFRESVSFLKENERHWQQRKIKEVDRIKEEEKIDRLAVCKQKKRRYGIQRMSKEENKRMKERTEERIIISQARANYWKRHRGEGVGKNDKEWSALREGILALEEDKGGWIVEEDRMHLDGESQDVQGEGVQGQEGAHGGLQGVQGERDAEVHVDGGVREELVQDGGVMEDEEVHDGGGGGAQEEPVQGDGMHDGVQGEGVGDKVRRGGAHMS